MCDMADDKVLKIAFVGAGAIHFGGAEMPWDHASRLEKLGGVQFVAIVDPLLDKARAVLESRLKGPYSHLYKDCQVIATVDKLLAPGSTRPDAVLLGVPPAYHGCLDTGKDLELRILKAGISVFIEKPVSVLPPEVFLEYVDKMKKAAQAAKVVTSVGYMFRYHAGVRKMRELILAHGGKVMAFSGHYYLAYSKLDKPFWWDTRLSGGPIVEQATHFCDLARFLVGDVDLDTVQTRTLLETDPGGAGVLSQVPTYAGSEVDIKPKSKIPRVTFATWRFQDGGLGSLMHAVALHGQKYEASLDVLMDGLRMTLYEPYHPECRLLVRSSGSDDEQVYEFGCEDLYEPELKTFLAAVRTGDSSMIQSPYTDAAKTYEFTWAIRRAGEKNCERI